MILPKPPAIAETLTSSLFRDRLNLFQHLLHAPANFFSLFSQLHRFSPQRHQLLLAFFQLLPQSLRIAFRRGLRQARRFVHLNGAINFLFQRLKIVCRNRPRHLLNCICCHQRHFPQRIFKLSRSILHLPVNLAWLLSACLPFLRCTQNCSMLVSFVPIEGAFP